VLIAIGIFLIIAGLIIIFFGDRDIPVCGGIVLRVFGRRPRLDDDSLPEWSYRFLIGGAFIVGGVMVLLKALKLAWGKTCPQISRSRTCFRVAIRRRIQRSGERELRG
jgi:MFS family permease